MKPVGTGKHLAAGALFLAAALWLTWPQAAVLGSALVGGPLAQADGWQNVWNMWWLRRALLAGADPFFTPLLFAPDGVPLGVQTLNAPNTLLTLPVLLLFGPLAAYGVAALLGFALSGLFTYVLALRVTGSYPGALAAGMLVLAAPQHVGRFLDGQLEHVTIQWIPLALLALLHATERPTLRNGLALGLSVALVAYTSWYHVLFLAVAMALWLGAQWAEGHPWRALLRPWLVALPLLLLVLLPGLASLPDALGGTRQTAAHWRTQAALNSVDVIDLLLPSAYHPLWGGAVRALQAPLHPNSIGWVTAPGYVALLLAGLGLWQGGRAARVWALLAGGLLLLALGPWLRVAGWQPGLPLPYLLLLELPGANFARRPSLAVGVALVPLALLAAFGVRALWAWLAGGRRLAVCGLLVGLFVLEVTPAPRLVLRDDTAPLYAALRGQPGALLVLPLDPGSVAYKSAALRAQMTHERPIIGGYVARAPDYPLARGAPLLGQLYRRDCLAHDIVPLDRATTLAALASYDITHIVLHTERLSPERRDCALRLLESDLALSPVRVAGPLRLYTVPPAAPQPLVFLGDGWHYLEQSGTRRWRWMGPDGELYITHPPGTAGGTVRLTLRLESAGEPRPVHLRYNRQPFGTLTATPGISRVYHLLLPARQGQHELRLEAPTMRDPDPAAPRDISLAVEEVRLHPLPLVGVPPNLRAP